MIIHINERSDKTMNKKRVKKLGIICLISIVAAILIIPNIVYRMNEKLVEQDTVVEDIDISVLSDNTFTGSYQSGQMSADVQVTIENGQYTAIILTDYAGINPTRAQKVIESIVENQTITPDDGDIGTQFTDKIVQKAVYYAIRYNYTVGE